MTRKEYNLIAETIASINDQLNGDLEHDKELIVHEFATVLKYDNAGFKPGYFRDYVANKEVGNYGYEIKANENIVKEIV